MGWNMYKNKMNYRKFVTTLLILYAFLAICVVPLYIKLDIYYALCIIFLPPFIFYGATNRLEKYYNKKNKERFDNLVFDKTNVLVKDYSTTYSIDKIEVLSNEVNDFSILKINDNDREICFICRESSGISGRKLVINFAFAKEYLAHFSSEFIEELAISEVQEEGLVYTFESRCIYAI